jgi:hypothetical protein
LSAYLFIRKYPGHSRSLFTHANGIIKYLPIDKDASNMLFDLTNSSNAFGAREMFSHNSNGMGMTHQQARVLSSGAGSSANQGTSGAGTNANPTKATKRSVSETKKKFVAAQQGWKCGSCKQQLPAWFEVDHKIRLDNGGSNHVDNLVALCRDCHGKKTAFENL